MAEYTGFGLAVKTKLLGPPTRTQAWLVDEVRTATGLYVKAPTQEDEREITFDDFTYAMQNESKELTDGDKQILLSLAKQLNDARKKRNGESK